MRPAIASININNLLHNYRLLEKRAGNAEVMAVVKANAYGHGLDIVAPALFDAGCRHFAVTDATEGLTARELVPEAKSIVLLSGVFDSSDAEKAATRNLTPVVVDPEQVQLLAGAGFSGSVWVKINTGMQRLGAEDAAGLIDICDAADISISGIMSHLACADTPEHPLNRVQCDDFTNLHRQLAAHVPASLLNSAGMVSLPDHTFEYVRPGIALYGIEPVAVEPLGLRPVMKLSGKVIQVQQVEKGAGISYGASFTAPSDMQIAVVSLGYGDGLPRLLSNKGHAVAEGSKLPIVGRICMDFALLDCGDSNVRTGDMVEFWGENCYAGDVADSIGTIAYELFTGITERVTRKED